MTHTRRGRPKDPDKRDAIMAAAKELFIEHGYAATRMDHIAKVADVSKLTLYSHFKDKDALFQYCVAAKCAEHTPSAQFDPHSTLPLRSRLIAIGRSFMSLVMSDDVINLYRTMAAEARQPGKLGRLFFEAGPQRTLNEFSSLLGVAHRLGELRVPDRARAANHFFCMLKGVHHLRVMMGERRPSAAEVKKHVDDVVNVFLKAYRVET